MQLSTNSSYSETSTAVARPVDLLNKLNLFTFQPLCFPFAFFGSSKPTTWGSQVPDWFPPWTRRAPPPRKPPARSPRPGCAAPPQDTRWRRGSGRRRRGARSGPHSSGRLCVGDPCKIAINSRRAQPSGPPPNWRWAVGELGVCSAQKNIRLGAQAPHKMMVFLLVPFRRHKMGGRLFLGDPCAKMLWLSLQKTHKIIQNGGFLLASL